MAILFLINLSVWAAESVTYTTKCYLKPCELTGDFDSDGKDDRAILIQDKIGKKGVEFKFANGKRIIIGAGKKFGNGGDDFSWMDHWEISKGKIEHGVSVLLEKKESASGIAHWNGSDFEWCQQGD